MNISSGIKSALFLLVCGSCTLFAFAADTISGTVRNQTTGKAAAGDEVILLRLKNGMEEESRTRTDANQNEGSNRPARAAASTSP